MIDRISAIFVLGSRKMSHCTYFALLDIATVDLRPPCRCRIYLRIYYTPEVSGSYRRIISLAHLWRERRTRTMTPVYYSAYMLSFYSGALTIITIIAHSLCRRH